VKKRGLQKEIEINDLNFDYYGSQNITVTANYYGNATYNASNDTQVIKVVWSNYSADLPRLIDFIYFTPLTNESKNVAPEGQDSITPIMNVTSYAYDQPFDFYIRINDTQSCVNQSMANNSVMTNEMDLNTTYQKILYNIATLIGTGGIWMEANYSCSTPRYFDNYTYDYYAKCTECV